MAGNKTEVQQKNSKMSLKWDHHCKKIISEGKWKHAVSIPSLRNVGTWNKAGRFCPIFIIRACKFARISLYLNHGFAAKVGTSTIRNPGGVLLSHPLSSQYSLAHRELQIWYFRSFWMQPEESNSFSKRFGNNPLKSLHFHAKILSSVSERTGRILGLGQLRPSLFPKQFLFWQQLNTGMTQTLQNDPNTAEWPSGDQEPWGGEIQTRGGSPQSLGQIPAQLHHPRKDPGKQRSLG